MYGVSRRKVLKGAGAAGASSGATALFSGCVEEGEVDGGGLKIGVLQPYSGVIGYWGQMSTWGFVSGLTASYGEEPVAVEGEDGESIGVDVEDRSYELLLRDTQQDAARAQDAATELVTDEEVDLLFGCISSDAVERVIEQVARPTDTTYVVGASSGIQIVSNPDFCGRKVFRANEHTGMEARTEGRYIGEETDTETIYLLGPDNVFGRSFAATYRRVLEEHGVEVVGERFVPPGYSEFRGILEDIDEEAEALGINFTAETLPNFLPTFVDGNVSEAWDIRGYAAFPGRTAMNLIGQVLMSATGEVTEEAIEQSKIGGLASRYHWNQYDNPTNSDFVSSYTEAYGTLPDFFTSGSYAAASAIAQAVEATGAVDGDGIAEEMYGMTVEDTPKGDGGYVFQEHNNQAKSAMTVAELEPSDEENWNAPLKPSEPVTRVEADDTAIPVDDPVMECDLR